MRRNSKRHKSHFVRNSVFFIIIVAAAALVVFTIHDNRAKAKPELSKTSQSTTDKPAVAKALPPPNPCASNTLDKLILVSVSQRHLWACTGTTTEYSSPVITGMEFLPADLTPVGTYHIYAKLTDYNIIGCDNTGCWNDYVNYYMKFLLNQYGTYGLHDAPWRSATDFGSISPDSPDASHGCVEMPYATAAWLFNWSPIGTTVTVET